MTGADVRSGWFRGGGATVTEGGREAQGEGVVQL